MTWLHVAALHAAIFTLAIHLGKRWTRHTPPNNKEHAE